MDTEIEFLKTVKTAAEKLIERVADHEPIRLITHNDADGIAAGAILTRTLSRLEAGFKVSCVNRIDESLIKSMIEEECSLIILSDIGSGYLDVFKEHVRNKEIIVLDHHVYIEANSDNILHINPILYGLDASKCVSGAGVSYLFSKEVDDANTDLSPLGVVGALADQQDKGDKKTLLGLNRIIESDAKNSRLLETSIDLLFYGYETRPIARAIAYTTNPFIPGLTGREDKCLAFLKDIGIELKSEGRWRAIRDLSEEEKRKIFSALSKHMIFEGFDPKTVYELVGTIYTLTREDPWTPMRDGREYASMLNACARMNRPGIGLAISLGDRSAAFSEGETILEDYRRKVSEYLEWIQRNEIIGELENIYLLKGDQKIDDRIIGVVASILLSTGALKKQMPLIAVAKSESGLLKISGRAPEELARSGVDLGSIMMKAAINLNGRGGGHDIAAGAYIPESYEEEFLRIVDKLVGEQRKIGDQGGDKN
ncbi:MAG: DHHA1 domain-containing protein [Candidatus Bathyarchaeia archaeon]